MYVARPYRIGHVGSSMSRMPGKRQSSEDHQQMTECPYCGEEVAIQSLHVFTCPAIHREEVRAQMETVYQSEEVAEAFRREFRKGPAEEAPMKTAYHQSEEIPEYICRKLRKRKTVK